MLKTSQVKAEAPRQEEGLWQDQSRKEMGKSREELSSRTCQGPAVQTVGEGVLAPVPGWDGHGSEEQGMGMQEVPHLDFPELGPNPTLANSRLPQGIPHPFVPWDLLPHECRAQGPGCPSGWGAEGPSHLVVGLEDAGRLEWSLSEEVSRLMSKLGPCRWPRWLANRAEPGPRSKTPGLTQRRPLPGFSATHFPGPARIGGLGSRR